MHHHTEQAQAEAAPTDRIPASYIPATWRSDTPIDPATDDIGLSFSTADGQVIRLRLAYADAGALAGMIRMRQADHVSHVLPLAADGDARQPAAAAAT